MTSRLLALGPARSAAGATRPARSLVGRRSPCGGHAGVDGECAQCRAKRLTRQRSAGRLLGATTRAQMEARFGHDFRNVRVHTGPEAAAKARSLGAAAFTLGRDLVFGAGRYAPQTAAGRQLIAHELTHVVQQSRSGSGLAAGATAAEEEAARLAHSVGPLRSRVRTAVGVARQEDRPEIRPASPEFSTLEAPREFDQPANGVVFNGFLLMIRRRGRTVLQARAGSGDASPAENERRDPIPDGNYFLRPDLVKPPVKQFQANGSAGAIGIDSGYQQIEDETVQVAWGKERIAIEPAAKCVPLPADATPPPRMVKCSLPDGRAGVIRDGFYIHGGSGSPTAGCIEVPDKGENAPFAATVFRELRSNGVADPSAHAKSAVERDVSSFPGSPRLVKGGLVLVDPESVGVRDPAREENGLPECKLRWPTC
jgi:hypothetical protein